MAELIKLTPTQQGFKRVQEGMGLYGGKAQAEMTAKFWSLYTGLDIKIRDVGMMMNLCKVARDRCGKKIDDNLVDIAGWMDVASWTTGEPIQDGMTDPRETGLK